MAAGVRLPATPSFRETAAKGSTIEVTAVARDGVNESEPARATARVGNQPPQLLQVLIEPLRDVSVEP